MHSMYLHHVPFFVFDTLPEALSTIPQFHDFQIVSAELEFEKLCGDRVRGRKPAVLDLFVLPASQSASDEADRIQKDSDGRFFLGDVGGADGTSLPIPRATAQWWWMGMEIELQNKSERIHCS